MRLGYGTSVTVPNSAERWYSEMRAGRAFMRGTILNASVGNVSEIQIFNPIASGRTLDLYRVICSTGVADGIQCRTFNTALATLIGTGVNLLAGGTAAIGEVRTAQPAVADGTLVSTTHSPAAAPFERISVWAWELDAGEGVIFSTSNVNIQAAVEFYFNEFVP